MYIHIPLITDWEDFLQLFVHILSLFHYTFGHKHFKKGFPIIFKYKIGLVLKRVFPVDFALRLRDFERLLKISTLEVLTPTSIPGLSNSRTKPSTKTFQPGTFHSTAVDVETVQKIVPWTSWSPLVGRGQKSAGTILAYLRQGTVGEWRSPWSDLKVSVRAGHILSPSLRPSAHCDMKYLLEMKYLHTYYVV